MSSGLGAAPRSATSPSQPPAADDMQPTNGFPLSGSPFTLRQLQIFAAVAEVGTISRAADRLYISHTAVSLALAQLEKALGSTLLARRRARGVELTSTGRSVLPLAHAVLNQASALYEEISGTGEITGSIALGCFTSLGPTMLPRLVSTFVTAHPRSSVAFYEDLQQSLGDDLLTGTLDLALTYDVDLVGGLDKEVLDVRRPGVLLSAEHPLALSGEPVSLVDLAEEPYVLLDSPLSMHHGRTILRSFGVHPHATYRSQSIETVRSLVGRGLGWSIVMQRPETNLTHEGRRVVIAEIAGEVSTLDVVLAWPRRRPLSRAGRAFVEIAQSLSGGEAPGTPVS